MIGKLNILDPSGHTVVAYDTELDTDTDEIKTRAAVEAIFNAEVLEKGGAAFVREPEGDRRIKTFELSEYEITVVPRLVGG